MRKKTILAVVIAAIIITMVGISPVLAAKPEWDGIVLAPLKTAQPYDWSAPDAFFTGAESGNVKYAHQSSSFNGMLELTGFKQAGPYVLTVDTADGTTLAGYDCDVWTPWAQLYGQTFPGGTNGCWGGNPYADVKLFNLVQYDSNGDLVIGPGDYYRGTIPFDVPLVNGEYNLKFFVKLDWRLTSPSANIMMMNDMIGDPTKGKVTQPTKNEFDFNYNQDLIITNGLAAEKLVLQTAAWCSPGSCQPPSSDPGYQGTKGVVFYKKVSTTFEGLVLLSKTVTPPTPQPLQIKLEGMGSMGTDAESNGKLGYIGRWWDNNTNSNINDAQYEAVKDTHNVLGYIVFDGFDTSTTSKTFALNSSYHTLWTPEAGRPAPGSVVMANGPYKANFALTENTMWWRGVFMSEHPLQFTIAHP